MAIYHLNLRTISKGKGHSAKAKHDYITREGKYTKNRHEFAYKDSGNMPDWAKKNPVTFWEAADIFERSNARLALEVETALPVELSRQEQVVLSKRFAQHISEGKHPYTFAVHRGKGKNPHLHLMMSERARDAVARGRAAFFSRANPTHPHLGGARKNRELKTKAWLQGVRQNWEIHVNGALRERGLTQRIDRRTLKEQGIDRIPDKHIGPRILALERKGRRTGRGQELLKVDKQFSDLKKELQEAKRELRKLERDFNRGYDRDL